MWEKKKEGYMIITLCMIEIFGYSTQGSLQSFWWSSNYRKWRACFATPSKPGGGRLSFWHDARIIIKECTGRRRLARESSSLATEQTLFERRAQAKEKLLMKSESNLLTLLNKRFCVCTCPQTGSGLTIHVSNQNFMQIKREKRNQKIEITQKKTPNLNEYTSYFA